ncbi:MAG: VOC family protein [Nannocystaceae bacterium]|nr:VOC family protein [Nannocystaceae bacterium]
MTTPTRWALLLAALAPACAGSDHDTRSPAAPAAAQVLHVALTVSSLDDATAWFEQALSAQPGSLAQLDADTARWGRPVAAARVRTLSLGHERVVLLDPDGPALPGGAKVSNTAAFQHLALVVGDIDARWAAIAPSIDPISPVPQRIPDSNRAAAGIRAAYFRGPDAHALELIHYPQDKGAARWHVDGDRVLGIDHTAIGVADTATSLAFWRDVLGLEVVGESLNEGHEQAQLSGVPGARVHITALRGHAGLGVELLEYLEPGLVPGDAVVHPEGSAHAHTTVAVADLDATVAAVREAESRLGVAVLSQELAPCIACDDDRRAAMVRDPDGHVVQLVQDRR